jgi:murein DD-endopeptidase MepM/ murein hydrolase activator NlpD
LGFLETMAGRTAFGVLAAVVVTLVGAATAWSAPSLQSLQVDSNRLQQQLQRTRAQASQARARERAAKSALGSLRQTLEVTTTRLQDTRYRLQTARARLALLSRDLVGLQHEYAHQRRATIARLRFLQRQRPEQWWGVLIGSRNLNTMLDRRYQLVQVFARDRRMLSALDTQRRRVTRQRMAVEEQKNDISLLAGQLSARRSQLDQQTAIQASLVHRLSTERQAYEAAERRLASDSRRLASLIRALIASQRERFNRVQGSGQMVMPTVGRLSSRFGMRFHPIFRVHRMHTGLDIAAPSGTAIRAADDGTVIFAGWYGGYGRCVIVSHGGTLSTLYGHTSRLFVEAGQTVKKGQTIAAVGSTGFATGPHLHFEVRVNGGPVDPMPYLR